MKKTILILMLLSIIALNNIQAEEFDHIQKETISETDSYDRAKDFINTVSENKKAVLATGVAIGLITAKPANMAYDKWSGTKFSYKKKTDSITVKAEDTRFKFKNRIKNAFNALFPR